MSDLSAASTPHGVARAEYHWTDVSVFHLTIWVLAVILEVTGAVFLLRENLNSPWVHTACFGALGLTFALGLLLLVKRFEIWLDPSGISTRQRSLFARLLKKPWIERRILRQSVIAFRLDKSPWMPLSLVLLLDDGTFIRVPGNTTHIVKKNQFENFVTDFRLFASVSGRLIDEHSNIWRTPRRQVYLMVLSVLFVLAAVLFAIASMRRHDLAIVSFGAAIGAFQGIRFLRKRS